MDTVCALALMQEEEAEGSKRKLVLKTDHQPVRSNWKSAEKLKDHKKADDSGQKSEDELASLLAYFSAKVLCFKCGDKWGRGHTCPAQVPLHIVDEMMTVVHQSGSAMPVQNEESDSDDGLELLAVQQEDGQPSTKVRRPTMRLLGWVGKHQALILVDSGSASTFIRTCFAEKCGLPMEPSEYSQFTVAHGGLMICVTKRHPIYNGCVKDTHIAGILKSCNYPCMISSWELNG
jgi:hypothetical protein